MSQTHNHLFVFGQFRLDATEHLLYRQTGEVVPLKPKAVETLELLVMQRGRLLTKTELLERLWPDAVVEESNLSQNIYLLRKVLGLTAGGRNYIETVPKRGYRFVAEVEEIAGNGGEGPEERDYIAAGIAERIAKAAPIDSLAVLPMANESDDPNIEYLSDGITESIINRLSQLPQLKVMARSTVFQYKSRSVLPQKAARDLGVRAIVTGRVMQLGQRLIVRTELVDAATGWQLWGDQFDRASTDILEIQETIAHEISSKLQLKLTGEDRKRLTKRYTESTEAYHLFIKGRYYLHKRLNEVMPKAIEYFQQAIDVDPVYAPAYVGLADCYPLLSLYGALEPREAYPKAKAAARRALEIDDALAEAHNSLGVIKLFYEWDWTGAEQAFQQAIELNPGYADAYQRYGMLLVARGRFDEATVQFDHAQTLDPLSLITKTISGTPFIMRAVMTRRSNGFRK
ncbi:MAG TPA: winged helix-turn-helix domain-containing protein [Pyrinomonadaceae bacterium]|nr:winged helix-turn-helix domain-containing protein [Pyrinomonadaceae bacterium]